MKLLKNVLLFAGLFGLAIVASLISAYMTAIFAASILGHSIYNLVFYFILTIDVLASFIAIIGNWKDIKEES